MVEVADADVVAAENTLDEAEAALAGRLGLDSIDSNNFQAASFVVLTAFLSVPILSGSVPPACRCC